MKRLPYTRVLIVTILFLLTAQTAFAQSQSAGLIFSIPPKQIEEGERLSIDIRVNSPSQSINAISSAITFPSDLLRVVSVSKERSIINLWTREPAQLQGSISFEGVILNPGFQGNGGLILRIVFEGRKAGEVRLNFSEGAVLANDGRGSNVLTTLGSTNFRIIEGATFFEGRPIAEEPTLGGGVGGRLVALPVIIDYSPSVEAKEVAYLKGKGEPNALTKIVFKDVSLKSLGEQLLLSLQTKKKKLSEVLVQNDSTGAFEYTSASNLVAGVYNATPFLVDTDTNTEKAGLGVQLLVTDSKLVRALIVLINVLGLLIPVVGLVVIIYFIPWYSWKRMRVLKKKLSLEEEKVELTEHQLARQDELQDKLLDKSREKFTDGASSLSS